MSKNKKHIQVPDRFYSSREYGGQGGWPSKKLPKMDRMPHGRSLRDKYTAILRSHDEKECNFIDDGDGIYVDMLSQIDQELPLEKLDNKFFELMNLRKENNQEIATVFIAEKNRMTFLKKVNKFLTEENENSKKPKEYGLINSISDVKLSDLRSFWTDKDIEFPADQDSDVWWEIWIKDRKNMNPKDTINRLCEELGAEGGELLHNFF